MGQTKLKPDFGAVGLRIRFNAEGFVPRLKVGQELRYSGLRLR